METTAPGRTYKSERNRSCYLQTLPRDRPLPRRHLHQPARQCFRDLSKAWRADAIREQLDPVTQVGHVRTGVTLMTVTCAAPSSDSGGALVGCSIIRRFPQRCFAVDILRIVHGSDIPAHEHSHA